MFFIVLRRRSLQTPAIAISSDLGSSRHAAMVEPIAEVPSNTSIGVQSSVTIEGDSLVAGSQDAGTAKDVSTSNSAFDSQVASQTTGGNEHVAASQSSDSIVRGAMVSCCIPDMVTFGGCQHPTENCVWTFTLYAGMISAVCGAVVFIL